MKTTKCPKCGQPVKHKNPTVTYWAKRGWLPPCDKCMEKMRKPEPVGQLVGELSY